MCKQHLKLVKEVQLRSYDGLISHTSLVVVRYNLLTLFQRERDDQRSFGGLFRMCNEELSNISFIEALGRIMQLAMSALCEISGASERMILNMLDVIMGKAITFFGLKPDKTPINTTA